MQFSGEHIAADKSGHTPISIIKRVDISKEIMEDCNTNQRIIGSIIQKIQALLHHCDDFGFRKKTVMNIFTTAGIYAYMTLPKIHTIWNIMRVFFLNLSQYKFII